MRDGCASSSRRGQLEFRFWYSCGRNGLPLPGITLYSCIQQIVTSNPYLSDSDRNEWLLMFVKLSEGPHQNATVVALIRAGPEGVGGSDGPEPSIAAVSFAFRVQFLLRPTRGKGRGIDRNMQVSSKRVHASSHVFQKYVTSR